MNTFEHTMLTWGLSIAAYNQEQPHPTWGNIEGDFYESLPENIQIKNKIDIIPILDKTYTNYDQVKVDEWNERISKLFESKVQQVIDGLLRDKPTHINQGINFEWYLPFTRKQLAKAVYHTIQDSILNHWNEISASSSFNTNSLSINNDLTNWIVSAQQRNTAAWNALQISKINHYKVIGPDRNTRAYKSKNKMILATYDESLLIDNKGTFNSLADAIKAIAKIDRYDYVVIENKGIYRFEGIDYTDEKNWEQKGVAYV